MHRLRLACGLGAFAAVVVGSASCSGEGPKAPPSFGLPGTGGSSSEAGSTSNTSKGGAKSHAGEGGAPEASGGDDSSTGGEEASGEHCKDPWSAYTPVETCDLSNLADSGITLSGEITKNTTLESGKFYSLSGEVKIMPGVTLTIEPCVKVLGTTPDTVLAVMPGDDGDGNDETNGAPKPGGKLQAVGEPDRPIVFTSNKPAGQRTPGDWGGVMIMGNAQHNEATAIQRPQIEGLAKAVRYGWHTPDYNTESSGALAYVRIEYASRQVSDDNETNGLTFGAVGSGTTVHHVMVANSNDDCFEFFGGTVNAIHLIALNCDDDMFDTDRGYSGSVQFAFGRQFKTTLEKDSNGFEMDNFKSVPNVKPKTSARWSNVTLCGTREKLSAPRIGMVLREGVAGSITNAIVTGFDGAGLALVNGPPQGATPGEEHTTITLTHSLVFDNKVLFQSGLHSGGTDWLSKQEGNGTTRPSGFCDCYSDPPVPFPAAKIQGAAPTGFADESADYVGAFKDATPESNWMVGKWVDWAAK